MDALDAILGSNDVVAVLGREVSVRLVDISASGCLLESSSRLEAGTTGRLKVVVEDEEYLDDVRIMRCREREGAPSVYQLGAEFLWTTNPIGRSLRRVIARLQNGAIRPGRFEQPN